MVRHKRKENDMGKVISFYDYKNEKTVHGEEVGVVHVFVYKDATNGLPFFYIESDNEEVLPISEVIEDSLCDF